MSIILHYLGLPNRTHNKECDIFRAAALDTWYRIKFSRSTPGMKIYETAVTQNLVYELNLLKYYIPSLSYSIFESIDEATNGDDLEICINSLSGYTKFAVQSKIIYHSRWQGTVLLNNGTYKQFKHYTGTGPSKRNQIDLLLTYAKVNGCIPIYLLYNFVSLNLGNKILCGVHFNTEQYGCSIVSAPFLKNNYAHPDGNLKDNVSFTLLHPRIAKPWFILTCCFENYDNMQILNALGIKELDHKIKTLKRNEIYQNKNWKLLEFKPSDKQANFEDSPTKQSDKFGFKPKFRIVLDNRKKDS